jgi:hypothetical protein
MPTTKWGALLFLATAAGLSAQNQNTHPDDDNRDGTITRREWRGDARSFRDLDRNRDGVLSGNEVPGVSRRGRADRDRNRTDDQTRPRTGQLDKNGSGVVEGYEWPYNAEVFHQLDRDGNGVLSQNELQNMDSVTLRQLDKNGNGRLDENEWRGGFADFNRLDNNRDGRVSSEEYFERGGEWRRRQRFDAWDTNRDGILQSTEWKGEEKLFHSLDTDGDTKVSWEEFRSDRQRYVRPGGLR